MIKRTLYFGNPAYLSLRNSQMVLRNPVDKTVERTFPVEDLGVVMLDNRQITITQGLMEALLQNNCAVVTCDSRHMPSGLLLPLEANTLQSERFRDQIGCSKPLKKQLWQQTVQAKIRNQARALELCVPECETRNMHAWIDDVRSDDAMNLEGRAAAYYWRNFFPTIDKFTRDPDGDYPNNLLNYGYAILRAVVARSLVAAGLLPTLGIHHRNRYNAYCLADDVMEPYRPVVDCMVWEMANNGEGQELTTDVKRTLLTLPTIDVTLGKLKRPLMIATELTAASIAQCFRGERRNIQYPTIA